MKKGSKECLCNLSRPVLSQCITMGGKTSSEEFSSRSSRLSLTHWFQSSGPLEELAFGSNIFTSSWREKASLATCQERKFCEHFVPQPFALEGKGIWICCGVPQGRYLWYKLAQLWNCTSSFVSKEGLTCYHKNGEEPQCCHKEIWAHEHSSIDDLWKRNHPSGGAQAIVGLQLLEYILSF